MCNDPHPRPDPWPTTQEIEEREREEKRRAEGEGEGDAGREEAERANQEARSAGSDKIEAVSSKSFDAQGASDTAASDGQGANQAEPPEADRTQESSDALPARSGATSWAQSKAVPRLEKQSSSRGKARDVGKAKSTKGGGTAASTGRGGGKVSRCVRSCVKQSAHKQCLMVWMVSVLRLGTEAQISAYGRESREKLVCDSFCVSKSPPS